MLDQSVICYALRVQIKKITAIDDIKELKTAWNELAGISPTDTIFLTFEWNLAWLETFNEQFKPCIWAGYSEDRLIAIAPMCLTAKRVNGLNERVLGFIGAGNFSSDYCDFLYSKSNPEILSELVDDIFKDSSWTLLELFNLPQRSISYQTIADRKFSRSYCNKLYNAPACNLTDHSRNKELLNKKSLKRHYNYFSKLGLNFEAKLGLDRIIELLPIFFEQHKARRALAKDESLFSNPLQQEFYKRVASELQDTNWLRFSALTLGQEYLAFHFGFGYKERFTWYKPSFNVKYEKKSPGEALLRCLLEQAIQESFQEFDFTVGNEAFKYRFSDNIREIFRIRVYRRNIGYYLMLLKEAVKRLIKGSK